jgi:hypothetical protein
MIEQLCLPSCLIEYLQMSYLDGNIITSDKLTVFEKISTCFIK